MRCLACSAAPSIWAADPPNLSPGPPIVTMLREAVIVATARTPMGRYGGQLKDVRPDDLAAIVLKEVCERAQIKPAEVSDVSLVCANQAGEDNRNVARMALLLAGFPPEVPGATVNRLCGSGLEAVVQAARAIASGEPGVHVGGGRGSMSRCPWVDLAVPCTALGWRFVNPRMEELYGTHALGETAEILAERYGISRRAQDEFALESHRRAARAGASGRWRTEVVPVEVAGGMISEDEGPRPDTSLE